MLEVNINIRGLEPLTAALVSCTKALLEAKAGQTTGDALPVVPAAPVVPTASAVSTVPAEQPPAPAAVPVTAPTYTLDQIARAGAALVDAGKMEQLRALLGRYGVSAVTQLPPDQFGVFATELRALGAQI